MKSTHMIALYGAGFAPVSKDWFLPGYLIYEILTIIPR